jgi:hypothetical protein
LDERYERPGGFLRYLLWPKQEAIDDLQQVLNSKSDQFISALDPECTNDTLRGRLIQYSKVDANFRNPTAELAFEHVKESVFARFLSKERYRVKVFADAMKLAVALQAPMGYGTSWFGTMNSAKGEISPWKTSKQENRK